MTLALLWLTSLKDPGGVRAWKGQDWDTMERFHSNGYISDPKSKAKSVVLSEEGEKRSKELFEKTLRTQTLDRMSNIRPVPAQILAKEGWATIQTGSNACRYPC
jgi:hypothetical protein